MKKVIFLFSIFIFSLFLSGCSFGQKQNNVIVEYDYDMSKLDVLDINNRDSVVRFYDSLDSISYSDVQKKYPLIFDEKNKFGWFENYGNVMTVSDYLKNTYFILSKNYNDDYEIIKELSTRVEYVRISTHLVIPEIKNSFGEYNENSLLYYKKFDYLIASEVSKSLKNYKIDDFYYSVFYDNSQSVLLKSDVDNYLILKDKYKDFFYLNDSDRYFYFMKNVWGISISDYILNSLINLKRSGVSGEDVLKNKISSIVHMVRYGSGYYIEDINKVYGEYNEDSNLKYLEFDKNLSSDVFDFYIKNIDGKNILNNCYSEYCLSSNLSNCTPVYYNDLDKNFIIYGKVENNKKCWSLMNYDGFYYDCYFDDSIKINYDKFIKYWIDRKDGSYKKYFDNVIKEKCKKSNLQI